MAKSMYNRQFWLLCTSNLFFTASFQMIIPELPKHLSKMGGVQYLGLIIALFTLTAGFSRPFSGKLTDSIGRLPLMIVGSLVCFVCGIMYIWVTSIWGFLILRLIHGFSTGTKPTATAAYIIDVVPENRRGEAAGMLGLFSAFGMSSGPAIGDLLATNFSANTMFAISALFGLISIAILYNLKETLPHPKPFKMNMLRLNRSELFEKDVKDVFWVMCLVSVSTGVCLTIVPFLSEDLNMPKSTYFIIYTIASIIVRFSMSKISDKKGRIPVLLWSNIGLAISMVLFAFCTSNIMFWLASIFFGIAWGLNSPTLTAWTADIATSKNRGKAMATMYIALEFGIGLGALMAGFLYNKWPHLISISFWATLAITLWALAYLWFCQKQTKVMV